MIDAIPFTPESVRLALVVPSLSHDAVRAMLTLAQALIEGPEPPTPSHPAAPLWQRAFRCAGDYERSPDHAATLCDTVNALSEHYRAWGGTDDPPHELADLLLEQVYSAAHDASGGTADSLGYYTLTDCRR